ncbi:amidohydrolase family protein [Aestuariirhabdus sp. Z084]|uniref:N-acyl-D-amino-acid deacylase family protein n=1 Tax=Aestuariirhabdus haliotis TaxID=2918751 RepID=UPI00201B3C06|nr:amidohydrolase family protein [Aestuariirhabdus haliotis]MCL6416730.1 amidohydrolase family protein [Aestuariirhabdus haliotis]MCL6420730.1 amidohydrolase family protein [Aestuariirhabdus haliotis]
MSDQQPDIDILIKNAKVFNNGETPVIEDVAIAGGKIVSRGPNLSEQSAGRVIDATGQWLMPGLFDIHTHYDLELEVAPGLPESTRHGTTTVVIANCSLGLAFGAQRDGANDPIVDCYARVENIPKSVLRSCADKVDWSTPQGYLEHLEQLSLGPNVVTLMPHSMLRIEAMGFENSISRDPSTQEVEAMKSTLRDALKQGYAGFSTDALPFHYLAGQPHCDKTIPTQFAKYGELKQLTQVVREQNSLWQATPPKDSVIGTLKTFLLTSGRLHGKPLKTTVVAALDLANNWKIARLAKTLSRVLNSKWVQGSFHMQALGAPFKTWSDGAITPLAEEIPELRRLNETELEDRATRLKILNDAEYIKTFRKMWMTGKTGWNLDRLKRKLNLEDYAFNRTLADMTVDLCPQSNWQGMDFQTLFDRVLAIKAGNAVADMQADEKALVERDFFWVSDEADFMLQILRTFDTDISWCTITANRDIQTVRELLMDPLLLPGFNDCGAHLTNMAFYDVNLRSLKLAAEGGDKDVSYMVKRLTKDAADVFGVDGGTLYEGDVADLILINPDTLARYDGEASVERVYREEFSHHQLVNRSDEVVDLVLIGGKVAWEKNDFSDAFGREALGRLLRAKNADVAA